MKIEKPKSQVIVYFMLLIFVGLSSCESDKMFSVQNCYGGSVEVTIEFGEEQSKLAPEVVELLNSNQISFELGYPEIKEIFKTSQGLEQGLPIKRMIIIRDRDTTILKKGDEILPMMDTDLIGEATYTICI